jgi:dipeptidyl aminopeptidase/acylaminoacyl peptidase
MCTRTVLTLAALCASLSTGFCQKKPLEHSVYDSWKSIRGTSLSHDGKWILYIVAPQDGDSKVEVKSLQSETVYVFDRGSVVQFSNDSKFVVATVVPPQADVKKAAKDKVPAADLPKNSLLILNLSSGEQTKIEKVTSFRLPAEDSGWLTYKPEPPKEAVTPAVNGSTQNTAPSGRQTPRRSGSVNPAGSPPADGAPLVIRNLTTGKEQKLEHVGDSAISKDGTILAYTVVSKEGKEDGVYWLDLRHGTPKGVSKGKFKVSKIALNDETKKLVFLCEKPPKAEGANESKATNANKKPQSEAGAPEPAKKPSLAVFVYDPKTDRMSKIAGDDSPGIPKGWVIGENSPLSFSEKGTRVFFGTVPKPLEEKKDDTPDSEKVSVDIWNWQDTRIMPEQILQTSADQRLTYQAVAFLDSGKIVQLESVAVPSVVVGLRGEGDFATGSADRKYRLQRSWGSDYFDFTLINVRTGESRRLLDKSEGSIAFSPDAKFLAGYDPQIKQYFVIDPVSLKRTDFKIPTALYNELDDTPSTPPAYGEAGWTKNDAQLLVYDAYDIWSIDPTAKTPPANLTGGMGRLNGLRLRIVKLDPDARSIDLGRPLLLAAFDTNSKAAGFYTLNLTESRQRPSKLVMDDKMFTAPIKAKNADVLSYTRQDFVEFPDVWVANADFSGSRKLSNANPQQAQYNWGTAELVNWISGDGQRLQGILIKPENFSYGKKYPMVTYFYERLSDTLHAYHPPAPSASTVNLSYFASNGYVVFVPDIPYKTGYPGESSLSAIVTGVLSIVNRGYVDPTKLGIQGQSWGGYEVAYLVTQTNLFACACSGAAVADMFSAYGGIRYGTGILRQGQYEQGQSRIGGSIWEKPLRYLENSPLFWLDKVETPLLMMHNDKDGAVPFTQGIELFSGLRRLRKPAWLVSYNGEDHNLVERKNRKDWSVRLSQFFDHYLKGAPMPVWMSKGVPATMKGKTFGFELDPGAGQ